MVKKEIIAIFRLQCLLTDPKISTTVIHNPQFFPSKPNFFTTSETDLDRETTSVPVMDGIPMWVVYLSGPVN